MRRISLSLQKARQILVAGLLLALPTSALAESKDYFFYQEEAKKWVARYFEGRFERSEFESELMAVEAPQLLLSAIHARFFDYSLEHLKTSKSSAAKKIMKMYSQHYGNNERPLFQIAGHLKALSPTSLQAGFHRGNGSIFMDPFRISPNEWMMIFSHELIHALDDRMFSSIEIFGDVDKTRTLFFEIQGKESIDGLSKDAEKFLWQWVESGLDRGLFAEYRVWTVTAFLYREQVAEGSWQRIDWFEKVLSGAKSNLEIAKNVYQYLDARSQNPAEEPFTYPVIMKAIETLREKSRFELPSLWNFKGF